MPDKTFLHGREEPRYVVGIGVCSSMDLVGHEPHDQRRPNLRTTPLPLFIKHRESYTAIRSTDSGWAVYHSKDNKKKPPSPPPTITLRPPHSPRIFHRPQSLPHSHPFPPASSPSPTLYILDSSFNHLHSHTSTSPLPPLNPHLLQFIQPFPCSKASSPSSNAVCR